MPRRARASHVESSTTRCSAMVEAHRSEGGPRVPGHFGARCGGGRSPVRLGPGCALGQLVRDGRRGGACRRFRRVACAARTASRPAGAGMWGNPWSIRGFRLLPRTAAAAPADLASPPHGVPGGAFDGVHRRKCPCPGAEARRCIRPRGVRPARYSGTASGLRPGRHADHRHRPHRLPRSADPAVPGAEVGRLVLDSGTGRASARRRIWPEFTASVPDFTQLEPPSRTPVAGGRLRFFGWSHMRAGLSRAC
jgi:hypothetical protein